MGALKPKKRKMPEDMSLQITSMADIFMILLVFLLKNYSTSLTNLAPTAQISLPVAKVEGLVKETLKLEVAKDIVVVDQKPVVRLNNFEFLPSDFGPNGTSNAVAKVLHDQRQLEPDPNTDSTLVVMADQATPYSTLKRIIASAAGAGFIDLQLIVVQED